MDETDSGKHDDDCANIYAEFVTKFAGSGNVFAIQRTNYVCCCYLFGHRLRDNAMLFLKTILICFNLFEAR